MRILCWFRIRRRSGDLRGDGGGGGEGRSDDVTTSLSLGGRNSWCFSLRGAAGRVAIAFVGPVTSFHPAYPPPALPGTVRTRTHAPNSLSSPSYPSPRGSNARRAHTPRSSKDRQPSCVPCQAVSVPRSEPESHHDVWGNVRFSGPRHHGRSHVPQPHQVWGEGCHLEQDAGHGACACGLWDLLHVVSEQHSGAEARLSPQAARITSFTRISASQAGAKELVAAGATVGESPAAVVAACSIVFAIVSDPAAADALAFMPKGVVEGMGPGKAYIDVSTGVGSGPASDPPRPRSRAPASPASHVLWGLYRPLRSCDRTVPKPPTPPLAATP